MRSYMKREINDMNILYKYVLYISIIYTPKYMLPKCITILFDATIFDTTIFDTFVIICLFDLVDRVCIVVIAATFPLFDELEAFCD